LGLDNVPENEFDAGVLEVDVVDKTFKDLGVL
jgi:hypothetical protein